MDKYFGIKRIEVSAQPIEYKVKALNEQKREPKPKANGAIFRYIAAIMLVLVCVLGKFVTFEPVNTASSFILEELNKDYIEMISERLDEQG